MAIKLRKASVISEVFSVYGGSDFKYWYFFLPDIIFSILIILYKYMELISFITS
jgi:hypothetical protein